MAERFPEPAVQQRMEGALALINHDDCLLGDRELSILNTATPHHAQTRYLRRPGPGSGERLSLVLRYEIHDLGRFPWVPDVVSSGRLVQCPQEAAGKRYGTSGTTIGHASLPGAFSAAAGLGRRTTPAGQQYLTKLANKPGKGNAFTLLAQKLGRAVYDIFKRHTACEMRRFLSGAWSGADEPNASLDDHGLSLSFVLGHAGIAAS